MSNGIIERLKYEYERDREDEAIETYRKLLRLSNYAEVRTLSLPEEIRMKIKDSSTDKDTALELLGEFIDTFPRRPYDL